MASDEPEDFPPPWDEDRGAALVGKRLLIGLTYQGPDGESLHQMHGIITAADERDGIEITLEGEHAGDVYMLPPHLDALQLASPGEYRLSGTGEVVVDPDYLTTWVIVSPENDADQR